MDDDRESNFEMTTAPSTPAAQERALDDEPASGSASPQEHISEQDPVQGSASPSTSASPTFGTTAVNTPRVSYSIPRKESISSPTFRTRLSSSDFKKAVFVSYTKPSFDVDPTRPSTQSALTGAPSIAPPGKISTLSDRPLLPTQHPHSQDEPLPRTRHGPSSSSPSEQKEAIVVDFEGQHENIDPRNQSTFKRAAVSVTIGVNAFLISAFASAYLFVSPQIEEEFGANREVVTLGFVFYVLMWGFGPLIWAPLSTTIGRKPVYVFSVAAWTLINIGCARSQNLATLIVCRMLSGFLGSGCLCNGSGSNAEMWTGHARTRAVTLYSWIVFLGPVFGPLVGGAIDTYASPSPNGGWRWLFYSGIMAGCVVTLMHCLVMETNHNIILRKRAKALNKEHRQPRPSKAEEGAVSSSASYYTTEADRNSAPLIQKVKTVTVSATKMLFEEPIVLFVSLWQTTVMSVLYLFFEAFNVVYAEGHGFNAFQTGLTFLGVGVGMVLACAWAVTGELKLWERRVAKADGRSEPEMRVPHGLAGAILTVVGLFWFGYTSYPSVHWIVPTIGAGVYGAGSISVMLSTFSYVVDTYLTRAAPAFAAVGLLRSVVTSVLPLCGTQFFENLGPRNATLILALLALAQIATPVLAVKYGERLRRRSKFALKRT